MRRAAFLVVVLCGAIVPAACSDDPSLEPSPPDWGDAPSRDVGLDVIPLPPPPDPPDSPCELAGYRCGPPATHPKVPWPACGYEEGSWTPRRVVALSCRNSLDGGFGEVCCGSRSADAGVDASDADADAADDVADAGDDG